MQSKQKTKNINFSDDLVSDMVSNKKHNPIVTELFSRGRKSLLLYYTILFRYSKEYYTIQHTISLWKFQTKESFKKLHLIIHQILNFQDFMNVHKKCAAKPYSFLVIDTTLTLDNPLRFRENLVERI